mmetsp:Transcript_22519/g.50721  ORF Transcript_22519/g.50721 Transcript_22519/m.50721 type:complete len:233 (-) Transcript_22519:581-1279(-)
MSKDGRMTSSEQRATSMDFRTIFSKLVLSVSISLDTRPDRLSSTDFLSNELRKPLTTSSDRLPPSTSIEFLGLTTSSDLLPPSPIDARPLSVSRDVKLEFDGLPLISFLRFIAFRPIVDPSCDLLPTSSEYRASTEGRGSSKVISSTKSSETPTSLLICFLIILSRRSSSSALLRTMASSTSSIVITRVWSSSRCLMMGMGRDPSKIGVVPSYSTLYTSIISGLTSSPFTGQ